MRYLGSKIKILPYIEKLILDYKIDGDNFTDLFAGTGCVGDFFKDRYKIIANDFLTYSSILNKAKLFNSCVPAFATFKKLYKKDIFQWLNENHYSINSDCFIYHNYTPVGGRAFFTESNGLKIDGIRQIIESLKEKNVINDNEYVFLLASLIESVTRFANITGTFEAYLKFWDTRALNDFMITPLEMKNVSKINPDNKVFQEDSNNLVRKISGDIVYIDTPYTVTQYASAYHMLESLALYDNPKIKGVGGKRDRNGKNSMYARKNAALYEFEDLFRQLNFKHVIISYSNQGLVPLEDLIDLAKKFAIGNKVIVERINYQEYQNHRSSNKQKGEKLSEVLIYFKKDNLVIKSPLNYSGSKDTMFDLINRELPKHVGGFVDVMGGAFNVGTNIVATDFVQYNEIEKHVYSIVSWLLSTNKESIVMEVENCIKDFNLSKKNETAYLELRKSYNLNNSDIKLFVLHMYSFQNMLRFNSKQEMNTPVGVAAYSEDLKKRILCFSPKTPKLIKTNLDYLQIEWDSYPKDTVFYFDPPYFITNAAYNDGKRGGKGWGQKEEEELLKTMESLDKKGYKFMLSNVITHKGKTHSLLLEWAKNNSYNIIDAGKSGWRYEKKEVIIKNY